MVISTPRSPLENGKSRISTNSAPATPTSAWVRRLIPAHEGLGILPFGEGEHRAGHSEYRAAIAQANSLLAIEPHNSAWRDMAANAQLELAKNLLALGKAERAAQEASEAAPSPARSARAIRMWSDGAPSRRTAFRCARAWRLRPATAQALELSEQALASARSAR